MTSSQLEASAQAPCSSTITGLGVDPPPAVAVTAEAAWPGANASRTAARAAAKSAGRPISHVVRLTDMNAPFPGGASSRRPQRTCRSKSAMRGNPAPVTLATCQAPGQVLTQASRPQPGEFGYPEVTTAAH